MASSSGRYICVFNGEIYNFRDLRAEFGASHSWRGTSDTEVLLECFERYGIEESLKKLVGMFAIVVWDSHEHVVTLVRDRLGEKPLYYGWASGALWFASELKAIEAAVRPAIDLNTEAIGLFLRFGAIPSPHSAFRNFFKLPPGCCLPLSPSDASARPSTHEPFPSNRGGICAPQRYWDAVRVFESGNASNRFLNEDEAANSLESALTRSVSEQMVADVPVGAFLSGGIDSSCVVALMQKHSRHQVRTFSIGFHEQAFNEANHAKLVAQYLGTSHTELYVSPAEAQEQVHRMAEVYDEPFADASQIPTYLVSQLARKSVTVALSGDGGDEIFGGYNRYLFSSKIWQFCRRFPLPLRLLVQKSIVAAAPTTWDRIARLFTFALPPHLRLPLLGDKLHKGAALLSAESDQELYRSLISHWTLSDIQTPSRPLMGAFSLQDTFSSSLPFTERMMLLDVLTYLPDDILVKVDRAAMSASLETRAPFLDHRLIELASQLPLSLKIRGRTSKYLLRKVLAKHIPKHLWDRPKMGFGVPIGNWLRGPLRPWAEELLSDKSLTSRGLFLASPIRRKWIEHLRGVGNWEYQLWDILMLQSWLEARRIS